MYLPEPKWVALHMELCHTSSFSTPTCPLQHRGESWHIWRQLNTFSVILCWERNFLCLNSILKTPASTRRRLMLLCQCTLSWSWHSGVPSLIHHSFEIGLLVFQAQSNVLFLLSMQACGKGTRKDCYISLINSVGNSLWNGNYKDK